MVTSRNCRSAGPLALAMAVLIVGAASASAGEADERDPDLGGDDIDVLICPQGSTDDLAIASDGTLFSIIRWSNDDDHYRLTIRRSTDGGTTWTTWAVFGSGLHSYESPCILVVEGDQDRVVIGYLLDPDDDGPTELHLAWSPLDLALADFSHDTTLAVSDGLIQSPSLATDATTYSDYYLFATWSSGEEITGTDIYFARSTDQGDTWESPYVIAAIAVTDRGYYQPVIAYGAGGYIHVAWYLGFSLLHEYDGALRYRRATNWAADGPTSWGNMASITSHLDGQDDIEPQIGTRPTGGGVVIASLRRDPDDYAVYDGISTFSSADAGATWSGATVVGSGMVHIGDIVYQDAHDRWLIGLREHLSWGFRAAPVSSPASWSELQVFSDVDYGYGHPKLVIDPTRDDRIGIQALRTDDDDYRFLFDAEWRADPGYPNFAWGFPRALWNEPVCDPAVVDVDGNGDLEIVFTDAADNLRVYRHDGSALPGWPVDVGTRLSPAPVAIDDLDGDGDPELLVGTADGRVFGFDAAGHLLSGFPYDTGRAAAVYLTIASLGGPFARAAILAAGNWVGFIGPHGAMYPGSIPRAMAGRTITSPPAVGDIDGDGRSEVVVAASQTVWAFQMDAGGSELARNLEATISGGIALADFDLDGEVEIVASLENGVVHVINENGSEFPGAWPVTAATTSLNGAAIADLRLLSTPEVVVTSRGSTVSLLNTNGSVAPGWPTTTGWPIYGEPVIGRVLGAVSDVIVGSRGYGAWAWDTSARRLDGWPRVFATEVDFAPAYGDLDQDGRAEAVFLTQDQLVVLDVGTPAGTSTGLWPMSGHDPGRTGCWECTEDLVSVDDAINGITRVSFASPSPNPVAGPTTFAYELPVAACAELAIYDLRGRRVVLLNRSELPAGRHQLVWNARDRDGRPLASGHYLATLKVKAEGVDETLTRKFTVVH